MPGSSYIVSKWFLFGIATAMLTACVSCGSGGGLSVDASFAVSRGDLVVSFVSNLPLAEYSVIDVNDEVILTANLANLVKGQIRVPPPARSGGTALRFVATEGSECVIGIPPVSEKALIRSPFESGEVSERTLLLPAGSITSIAIDLGEAAMLASMVLLEVESPLLLESPGGNVSSLRLPVTAGRYSVGGIRLVVWDNAEPNVAKVKATIVSSGGEVLAVATRMVAVSSLASLRAAVRILGAALPADQEGETFGGRREGFIDLRTNAGRIDTSTDGFPIARQSVTLASSLSEPVSVLVTVRVLTSDGKPAPAFDVPPGRPGPFVTSAALLPAEGRVTLTMPFFADSEKAVPGTYRRVITAKLAGSDAILASLEVPFEAGRSVDLALLVTGILSAATLLVFGWLLMRRSHVLDRFTTRQIVLAGLFAAASVVIVNVPVYFLTSITVFLLGPMGFLIDGLLSEFVFFALLTILVSIAPVQGICATVIGTRFLLGGVLLGMVTPVGALHAVSMGLALELAVFLSGTARHGIETRIAPGVRPRLAVLFAIANTLVSWIGFQLAIVLFRLHYADWYIFLSVAIGGFIYALLGGLAGRAIGRKLAEAVP